MTPPAVFYHVAAMNTWRSVVREQVRLLAHVGLTTITVGLLGDDADAAHVVATAAAHGVTATVAFHHPDLSLAELPTLSLAHTWARDGGGDDRPILYLHTKGVSHPADRCRTAWRRAMHRHTVADWPAHCRRLAGPTDADAVDAVGFCWVDSPQHPHFSGNVWLARRGWVAALPRPQAYRFTRPADYHWGGEPWRQRMFCETWIGSRPGVRVASLGCRNARLWEGEAAYQFDPAVPGFRYEDDAAPPVLIAAGPSPQLENPPA